MLLHCSEQEPHSRFLKSVSLDNTHPQIEVPFLPELPLDTYTPDAVILREASQWLHLDTLATLEDWSKKLDVWLKFRSLYRLMFMTSSNNLVQRNLFIAHLYRITQENSLPIAGHNPRWILPIQQNVIGNISQIVCKRHRFTTWPELIANLPQCPCAKSLTVTNRNLLFFCESLAEVQHKPFLEPLTSLKRNRRDS